MTVVATLFPIEYIGSLVDREMFGRVFAEGVRRLGRTFALVEKTAAHS
jgi:hypothetical protein